MTKKERLDNLEANLNFMSKCMAQMLEQQKKQLEEVEPIEEVEPPMEELARIIVNKINDKMEHEKIDRNDIIKIIESFNFKRIDTTRLGANCWNAIFVNEANKSIVKFIIDLELNSVKGYVLYQW